MAFSRPHLGLLDCRFLTAEQYRKCLDQRVACL